MEVDKLHKGSEAFKEGLLKYTNGVLTLNEKLLAKKDDLEKLSAGSAHLTTASTDYQTEFLKSTLS